MRFADATATQHRRGDDSVRDEVSHVGKLTLFQRNDSDPTALKLKDRRRDRESIFDVDRRVYQPRNDERSSLPERNPDGSLPRLDLFSPPGDPEPVHRNLEQLRGNIDAALEEAKVEQQLLAALRPLVEQVVGKLATGDGPRPTALRVAWNDKEYFSSQHLSGGMKHDRVDADSDDAVFGAVFEDLGLGLLGGLVAAGLDYVRFEQSCLVGGQPEYRPEQVGTQIQIGSLLSDVGGTGAALAYAALQWCFTNDLLFYAYAYLHDSKVPGWNDPRSGVEGLVSGDAGQITWASWSLLGLLTGKGREGNPMTFLEACVQGVLLGPMLALGLALLVEKCGLQNLAGGLLSVAIESGIDRELDRDAVVEALCIRLKIPPVQAMELIAKVAPLSGSVSGTRVTGVIQMSDDVVRAFIGCGMDFQQSGVNDQGKTIAHGQTTSLVCGVDVDGKPVSIQVSAQIPISQTWKDGDKKPLSPELRDELHVSDPKYRHDLERLALQLEMGPVDVQAEVRTSVALQDLFAGIGFQWQAGRFTLGGDAWLITGVRRHPDLGFALKLRVQF